MQPRLRPRFARRRVALRSGSEDGRCPGIVVSKDGRRAGPGMDDRFLDRRRGGRIDTRAIGYRLIQPVQLQTDCAVIGERGRVMHIPVRRDRNLGKRHEDEQRPCSAPGARAGCRGCRVLNGHRRQLQVGLVRLRARTLIAFLRVRQRLRPAAGGLVHREAFPMQATPRGNVGTRRRADMAGFCGRPVRLDAN